MKPPYAQALRNAGLRSRPPRGTAPRSFVMRSDERALTFLRLPGNWMKNEDETLAYRYVPGVGSVAELDASD
jgi:hypothetical protein